MVKRAWWTAALMAAVVLAAGGCGSAEAAGASSAAAKPGSAAIPADFPSGVPLPSTRLVEVSGGQVSRNVWIWTLRYAGDGHPAQVGVAEGKALVGAGFTATSGGVADDSFLRGPVNVTTRVDGPDYTMTVNVTT